MRTRTEYENVKSLLSEGKNQCHVARETGIPRTTIKDWVTLGFCPKNAGIGRNHIENPEIYLNESEERRAAYSFILGEYLGDGCVRKLGRTFRLGIYNDMKYEGLNQLIESRLSRVFPANKINRIRGSGSNSETRVGCWEISVYSNNIPLLFPQVGPGKKHLRKIELTPWQLEIVDAYPEEFIRGLFYSDGCIYDHKQNDYCYQCYSFVNKSKDIADYLSRSLKLIGVDIKPRWASDREIYVVGSCRKEIRTVLSKVLKRKNEIVA